MHRALVLQLSALWMTMQPELRSIAGLEDQAEQADVVRRSVMDLPRPWALRGGSPRRYEPPAVEITGNDALPAWLTAQLDAVAIATKSKISALDASPRR